MTVRARKILALFWGGGGSLLCDIVGLLQESKRPLPRKLRNKSERGFPGLSAPGSKKLKRSQKKS